MAAMLVSAIGIAAPVAGQVPETPRLPGAQPVYEFRNGLWFDGTGFRSRTVYTQYGTFQATRPAHVDSVFDLAGGYIVPPYGEAHNHNVADTTGLRALIARYLDAGVFYVKNPNALPEAVIAGRQYVNVPSSIDVAFAYGGFTGPGGHPAWIASRNIANGVWTADKGEGAFYHEIADVQDIAARWGGFLAYRPDFVKGYLLYSGDAEAPAAGAHLHGIAPPLLTALTDRAHAHGLRLSAHVETAADFRQALNAGVDEINHLPGFRGDEHNRFTDPQLFLLTEEDARRAAAAGVVVVTTLGDFEDFRAVPSDSSAEHAKRIFQWNLRVLRDAGVKLAIGSDGWSSVSVDEAFQLRELGIFSNLELLQMWTEQSSRTIFPNRLIGRLEPGYEASFLVLGSNPIEDFSATQDIRLRVKQGIVIDRE